MMRCQTIVCLGLGMIVGLFGFASTGIADDPIRLYYEESAQIELINAQGTRVLIDVNDPGALSSAPNDKDVLLTTHSHGDHYRLDFVKAFPGRQLKIRTGEIKTEDLTMTDYSYPYFRSGLCKNCC